MDLQSQSDEMLVRGFQQTADTQLLDELFSRYIGKVAGTIGQILLNRGAAEDATQETFVKAARALPKFKGKSTFSTWLYRIAVNTAKSSLAKSTRRQETDIDVSSEEKADHRPAPDRALEGSELKGVVGRAMASLPTDLRSAIVLTSVEGIVPAEAAKIEGVTRATMYWRIHQARQRLKSELQAYYDDRR